jgi:hypothetical protein
MKRLRHPIRAIREPFGTAGLIVACVALIAALGGTALAAAKLNSTQKKEVEKIAKKFAGKPGAPGAPGAAGPTGPQGSGGSAGKDGTNGTNGTNGAPGKSVQVSTIEPEEGKCEERAGAEVKTEGSGTAVEVCDGENGAPGPEGSPWTLGGLLPAGKTETGAWSFMGGEADGNNILASISFPIPLAAGTAPKEEHVHFQGEANFSSFCEHTSPPTAKPGELCIYNGGAGGNQDALVNAEFIEASNPFIGPIATPSSGTSGALLVFKFTGEPGEVARGFGVWAVTAPEN